eukprot:TRINITY_DN4522_c0_g1_i3.p1 TRINITY_DN4522_c0_g1~~TRINITY_DN4522_c0_g1_i3.p1  ORF type:complete len:788 (+),score=142.61 TRINITY_DN4522_c0_g1_i3:110-2365(+)
MCIRDSYNAKEACTKAVSNMIEFKEQFHFCFVVQQYDMTRLMENTRDRDLFAQKNKTRGAQIMNNVKTAFSALLKPVSRFEPEEYQVDYDEKLVNYFVNEFARNGFKHTSWVHEGFDLVHRLARVFELEILNHDAFKCKFCRDDKTAAKLRADFILKFLNDAEMIKKAEAAASLKRKDAPSISVNTLSSEQSIMSDQSGGLPRKGKRSPRSLAEKRYGRKLYSITPFPFKQTLAQSMKAAKQRRRSFERKTYRLADHYKVSYISQKKYTREELKDVQMALTMFMEKALNRKGLSLKSLTTKASPNKNNFFLSASVGNNNKTPTQGAHNSSHNSKSLEKSRSQENIMKEAEKGRHSVEPQPVKAFNTGMTPENLALKKAASTAGRENYLSTEDRYHCTGLLKGFDFRISDWRVMQKILERGKFTVFECRASIEGGRDRDSEDEIKGDDPKRLRQIILILSFDLIIGLSLNRRVYELLSLSSMMSTPEIASKMAQVESLLEGETDICWFEFMLPTRFLARIAAKKQQPNSLSFYFKIPSYHSFKDAAAIQYVNLLKAENFSEWSIEPKKMGKLLDEFEKKFEPKHERKIALFFNESSSTRHCVECIRDKYSNSGQKQKGNSVITFIYTQKYFSRRVIYIQQGISCDHERVCGVSLLAFVCLYNEEFQEIEYALQNQRETTICLCLSIGCSRGKLLHGGHCHCARLSRSLQSSYTIRPSRFHRSLYGPPSTPSGNASAPPFQLRGPLGHTSHSP